MTPKEVFSNGSQVGSVTARDHLKGLSIMKNHPMGPHFKYVNQNFRIIDPIVSILARFIILAARNHPRFVCIWVTPSTLQVKTSFKYGP